MSAKAPPKGGAFVYPELVYSEFIELVEGFILVILKMYCCMGGGLHSHRHLFFWR